MTRRVNLCDSMRLASPNPTTAMRTTLAGQPRMRALRRGRLHPLQQRLQGGQVERGNAANGLPLAGQALEQGGLEHIGLVVQPVLALGNWSGANAP